MPSWPPHKRPAPRLWVTSMSCSSSIVYVNREQGASQNRQTMKAFLQSNPHFFLRVPLTSRRNSCRILGISLELCIGERVIHRRRVIMAIVVALVATAGVYADMMPAFPSNGAPRPSAPACERTACSSPNSPSPSIGPAVFDLDLWPVASLPTTDAEVEPTAETPVPLQLLDRDPSSFDLCLYALMGLGLCKSAPWVKKLPLGGIPDWYHHGGPSQIGGSHAVGPDCLCSAATCFLQPHNGADDFMPQHCLGTIAALWRKPQRTPNVLASRGPPCTSERLSPTYSLT